MKFPALKTVIVDDEPKAIKLLEELAKEIPEIMITAYDRFAIEAIHHEAFDYLMKPVSPEELRESVQRLIARWLREKFANSKRCWHRLDSSARYAGALASLGKANIQLVRDND